MCYLADDAGLNGVEGSVEVRPYRGSNPLYKHGPIRVAPNKRNFEYADGKPFFWLGDTWWMGLCRRLHWPDEFQEPTADRKAKGFNVIQIVAGLYPDMPPFDPRGANEAGFPWQADYAALDLEFADGSKQSLRTDSRWQSSRIAAPGWNAIRVDASAWSMALVTAAFGDAPWGHPGTSGPLFAPQACGIGDSLRAVYVLDPRSVVVRGLRPRTAYTLTVFDPITGRSAPTGSVHSDARGEWHSAAPNHDQVLLLVLSDA